LGDQIGRHHIRLAIAEEADESEDLVFGRFLRSDSEVQASRLSEAQVESCNREDAAPLAPFGGTGAAEGMLARVGPTTRRAQGDGSTLRSITPKRAAPK
jgi:hypothetical protein